jgi:NAD(P)H-dependent flavin oxidoreductase YrpB (nitropropane dioxygenase family)
MLTRRRLLETAGSTGLALALGRAAPVRAASRARDPFQTRLTGEFGVEHPFVGAGMAFVSYAELTAAVSNAGGMGVLGGAPEPPPGLELLIRQTKALTSRPFGVDLIHATGAFGPFTTDAHIDVCVAERVPLVVFFWNTPPADWVAELHAAGAKVWMQVGSVPEALDAVSVGIDAIIAQGIQAGGHNKSTARTSQLVRSIARAVAPRMVLAAGGIASGADIVEAFAHGAEGVWVGTRLVASTEAYAHDEWKRRIVDASRNDTVITTLFGPEWPGQPIRVLRNRVVDEWAGRESEVPTPPPPPAVIGQTILFPKTFRVPYPMPKFSAIPPNRETIGDFEEMALLAGGESITRIRSVRPAAEIVEEMMSGARALAAHGR